MDVRRQVDEFGGEVQHGWTIWEWPGIAAEGEFHAVWKRPDGSLLDVTRKKDGESRILFAPDRTRVFRGRRVDNVRMAISRDPRVKEWIHVHERLQKMMSKMMDGIPFGTEVVLRGEAYDLYERAAQIELALAESRDARRASGR